MSDTGVRYPGTTSGASFTNSGNLAADDNNYATWTPASFDSGYPQHKSAQLYYDSSAIGNNLGDNSQIPTSETQKVFGGVSNLWGATITPDMVNAASFGINFLYANKSSSWVTLGCTNFGFAIPSGATIDGVVCETSDYYVSSRITKAVYVDYVRLTVYYTEGGGPSFQAAWARNSNSVLKVL